ncbi:hypothetical protein WA1_23300 [Scytonema hofmannii PCC 7110]|uniref:Uncharacterized protein n=1 Tax=Scytonema hofmannii PCC 7110 TaxID=128403 RepID=A0A139X8N1_9CYAN|nr:hypothetical protein [Scytonema hofmannii]KYC41047.1 hypothetical protein WA1_23300 [Scytonema hofmannii PCC 7110]
MSKFQQINIDFSSIDIASLDTDDEFRQEAKRLLPKALVQLGEIVGEKTWEDLQKSLKKPGGKLSSSQSEKRKFIQETGRTYHRHASSRERQELEDYIVEQLRATQNLNKSI